MDEEKNVACFVYGGRDRDGGGGVLVGALADFVWERVGDGHRHADGVGTEWQSGGGPDQTALMVKGFGIQGPAVSGSLQPECRKEAQPAGRRTRSCCEC